jgi:maleamate amidohydrolase
MSTAEVYRAQSFGRRVGWGSRPALLIVDFQVAFADPAIFGGYNIPAAIAATARLLATARRAGLPVAHMRYLMQDDGADHGPFVAKVPGLARLTADAPEAAFAPAVAPAPGEWVGAKRHASAFFGTPLASFLMTRQADTLLIAGCTTSGCIRASVIDASAYGLRPIVVADCVGDRAKEPHEANLFDMDQKYADVTPLEEVLQRIGASGKGDRKRA